MANRGSRGVVLALLVSSLAFLSIEGAWAQFPQRSQFGKRQERADQRGRPEQSNLPPAMALGTVEAVGPGKIQITSESGQPWLLQLLPNSEVNVVGTAAPAFVAAGQYITFSALVDKRHSRVDEKISKLKIFTPDETHLLGAFPQGAGVSEAGGAHPALAAPAKAGQPGAADAEREAFQITGRITGAKNGKLVVYAPNNYFKPSLRVELAEEPEIEIEISGTGFYQMARKGDKVQASGGQFGPQVMQVHEMTLTLAEPLGIAEKKPRRGEPSADSGPKEKEADQKETKAEEKE